MEKDNDGYLGCCFIDGAFIKRSDPDSARPLHLQIVGEHHLNNFHCSMPGGFYRSPGLLSAAFENGETFREAIKRTFRINMHHDEQRLLDGYSEKKLSQTPEMFFDAIDIALDVCGISRDEIRGMMEKLDSSNLTLPERGKIIQSIHQTILPAYAILRVQGYSHRDLIG